MPGQIKHGHAIGSVVSITYKSWVRMIQRCTYEKSDSYPLYGGRGITVCDSWKNSFASFLKDMGERPSKEHSLDRVDSDGNYEKINCRWSTKTVQSRNTSRNAYVTFKGETRCLSEWCELLNFPYARARWRVSQGWAAERVFSSEFHKRSK